MDYFGARYYASNMGRFMSPDWSAKAEPVPYAKLGDPQSLNLYGYMRNNPLSGVDADGHLPIYGIGDVINLAKNVAIGLGKTVANTLNFIGGDCGNCQSRLSPMLAPSNAQQAITMAVAPIVAGPVADAAFGGSVSVTASAAAPLETTSTTLFRAVDSTEMGDLQSTGSFNPSPNGADGKGFFYSQDSAAQFGAQQSAMGGPSTTVVTSTAPTDMVNSSYQQTAATEGRAVFIQNQNLPQVKPQVPPQQ